MRSSNSSAFHGASAAFTILELLVVVTIMTVLLSIMLPALSHVQATRERLACMVNLRDLGAGVWSHSMDERGRLPEYYAAPGPVVFDTVVMRRTDADMVNLGELVAYVPEPATYYCQAQPSEPLSRRTSVNRWLRPVHSSAENNGTGERPGDLSPRLARIRSRLPAVGANSAYPARYRGDAEQGQPSWTTRNYGNKVIYSDFVGVDGWAGQGRFQTPIAAPHEGAGYNRLFGDGSVHWADADPINDRRPVDHRMPGPAQMADYYQLLDVLP